MIFIDAFQEKEPFIGDVSIIFGKGNTNREEEMMSIQNLLPTVQLDEGCVRVCGCMTAIYEKWKNIRATPFF